MKLDDDPAINHTGSSAATPTLGDDIDGGAERCRGRLVILAMDQAPRTTVKPLTPRKRTRGRETPRGRQPSDVLLPSRRQTARLFDDRRTVVDGQVRPEAVEIALVALDRVGPRVGPAWPTTFANTSSSVSAFLGATSCSFSCLLAGSFPSHFSGVDYRGRRRGHRWQVKKVGE